MKKVMNAEISKELLNRVEEVHTTDPEERIPVLITVESISGLDMSGLESEGLDVQHSFPEINAISGTIPASHVTKLAQQPGIKKVEYDSKSYALSTS